MLSNQLSLGDFYPISDAAAAVGRLTLVRSVNHSPAAFCTAYLLANAVKQGTFGVSASNERAKRRANDLCAIVFVLFIVFVCCVWSGFRVCVVSSKQKCHYEAVLRKLVKMLTSK